MCGLPGCEQLSFFSLCVGKIGITGDISWPHPKTDSHDDKVASEMAVQFYVSVYTIPFTSIT